MKAACFSLVLFLLTIPGLHAQTGSMTDYPQISVSGEAVVYVVPDKIVITLGVETWDLSIEEAKTKNNDIIKDALKTVRRLGVPDKEIQTDHLSIEPRYKDSYRKEEFIGFFVRNTLVVTLDAPEKVEMLITRVLDAGVNHIHGIDFQSTQFKKHREEARTLALLAAKEKAQNMAAVLDQKIGRPMKISENYTGTPWGYWSGWGYGRNRGMTQNVMQNIAEGSGEIAETIALGKIAVRAKVGVTFSLQ
ncbi:MAG: hypothetical protein C0600_05895 [Ignavibacteria bacterium]|nr:MAG: hypothetical protein C0600_05895 [Ignavibacteria bacterium]